VPHSPSIEFTAIDTTRDSENSIANRIETGEKSGGTWKNLFGGSRRKIAKNKRCYANTFTTPLKDAVERR
jgi:hypothetical protein